MSPEKNFYELIDKYMSGTMTDAEQESFQSSLKNDPALQTKMDVYRMTDNLVIQNRLRSVKALIKQEEVNQGEQLYNFSKWKIVTVAVIIALLIGLTVIVIRKNPEKSPVEKKLPENTLNRIEPKDSMQKEIESVVNNYHPDKSVTTKTSPTDTGKANVLSPENNLMSQETENLKIIKSEHNEKDIESKSPIPEKRHEENTHHSEIADPCYGVLIEAQPTIIQPCSREKDGEILLSHVKGGTAPYTFIMNSQEENKNGKFDKLEAGKYHIEVIDYKGCKQKLSIFELVGKGCRKNLQFNPSQEELKLPVYEKDGSLSVFDKAGQVYFTRNIAAEEQTYWNGYSTSGELKRGYFVFIIQYKDGFVQEGSITIVP